MRDEQRLIFRKILKAIKPFSSKGILCGLEIGQINLWLFWEGGLRDPRLLCEPANSRAQFESDQPEGQTV